MILAVTVEMTAREFKNDRTTLTSLRSSGTVSLPLEMSLKDFKVERDISDPNYVNVIITVENLPDDATAVHIVMEG